MEYYLYFIRLPYETKVDKIENELLEFIILKEINEQLPFINLGVYKEILYDSKLNSKYNLYISRYPLFIKRFKDTVNNLNKLKTTDITVVDIDFIKSATILKLKG